MLFILNLGPGKPGFSMQISNFRSQNEKLHENAEAPPGGGILNLVQSCTNLYELVQKQHSKNRLKGRASYFMSKSVSTQFMRHLARSSFSNELGRLAAIAEAGILFRKPAF